MDVRTHQLLFGNGSASVKRAEPGEILATFKGFGASGRGREKGLDLMQRFGLITPEQRAAASGGGGAAASAAQAAEPAGLAAAADGAAAAGTVASDSIRNYRFVNGRMVPVGGAAQAQAATAAAPVVETIEQRMASSLRRLAELPQDLKLPALAYAVDVTAAAGLGDDSFDVLARSLASRPVESAIGAIDDAIRLAARMR